MDYKELIERLKCPRIYECPFDYIKSCKECQKELNKDIATAITDLLTRAEAAEKTADEYAESARSIALWLSTFCDRALSYPSMISNAARKVSLAYADMETRAEAAEARAEKAEREKAEAIENLSMIVKSAYEQRDAAIKVLQSKEEKP